MLLAHANVVALFLAFAAVSPGAAEEDAVKRRYRTTRVSTPPVIDGRFDDTCWTRAQWSRGFVQRKPHEGATPSEETAFQVVYDERYL